MRNKKEYIEFLWSNKSTSEIILVLHQLIDNSFYTEEEKNKTRAVLRGILAYTDRGESLHEHHREYLRGEWDSMWMSQRDNHIKQDILEWLTEPPF